MLCLVETGISEKEAKEKLYAAWRGVSLAMDAHFMLNEAIDEKIPAQS